MLADFLADLRQQRLRTTLTILGITWGTVAVVVLLAFGVGLEAQTVKRFHGLGERIVILFGGRTTRAFAGFGEGRYVRIREEDAALLAREISDIAAISPEYIRGAPMRRGIQAANPNVTGVIPVYGDLRNVIADSGGRFINDQDVAERRRVAVLGIELKKLLFGPDSVAVGQQVMIANTPFTVIGVSTPKQQSSSYASRDQDRVFIPSSTHKSVFGQLYVNNLVYRAVDAELTKAVEKRVYQVLGRKYRFDPADHDALGVWDTSEFEKMFGYMFFAFNAFFAIVGSFTLTVGGIGVANIMYIVVKERTREIGIRRSVGATRRNILFQFFAETFLVVGAGAVFGLLLSVAIVKLSALIPMQQYVGTPTISWSVAFVTLSLLAVIGFAAGLFPARKAANLDPVECLRY